MVVIGVILGISVAMVLNSRKKSVKGKGGSGGGKPKETDEKPSDVLTNDNTQ